MAELLIQYSTSKAFASRIIRILTHSPFSHTELVITPEVGQRFNVHSGLLGASGPDCATALEAKYWKWRGWHADPGGVIIRSMQPWPYLFPPIVARLRCSAKVHDETIAFALSQIEKPFDKKAMYAFLRDRAGISIVRRDWRDPAAWFCAELVTRAAEVGRLFPYDLVVTKELVSPNDTILIFNPFIVNAEAFADAVAKTIVAIKGPPPVPVAEKT